MPDGRIRSEVIVIPQTTGSIKSSGKSLWVSVQVLLHGMALFTSWHGSPRQLWLAAMSLS